MKHKLLRGLVALVLVCVLVVNVSPIRVSATGASPVVEIIKQVVPLAASGGAAAGGATLGTAAFSYVLGGLGVVVGGAALLTMVDRYMEYSNEMELAIYYYPDGTWSYGVDVGFVDRVRAFLFDCGYLESPDNLCTTVAEGETFMGKAPRVPCVGYAYSYAYIVDGVYKVSTQARLLCTIPNERYIVSETTATNASYYVTYNGAKYYFYTVASGTKSYTGPEYTIFLTQPSAYYHFGERNSTEMGFPKIFAQYGWTGIQGTGDLAIEYVAAPDVPLDVGYSDWYTNVRTAPDADTDDERPVLPIPLKPKADYVTQAESVAQTDVWQGSIEEAPAITPPVVLPETVGLTDIWQLIKGIPAALADVITGPIVGGLTKIGELIKSIPQAIAEAISAIFVPREDFLTAKWEAIRAEFAFADSIMTSGDMILGVLNGIDPEPPVIYIDLGASEGSYDIGGEVPFLDLRWYERYKPTGDAIISAFLWLVFVWRMFIKLPGIIGGLPGDFVMQGVTDLGLADRLPARKKEYENQRQENRRFFKK